MSVINQVLNQLEQRGAQTAPEQGMVRAVPRSRRKLALPLLAVVLALAGGIAAWQWIQMRKPALRLAVGPVLSPVEGPRAVAPPPVAAISAPAPVFSAPASAVPVSAVPGSAVVATSAVGAVSVATEGEAQPAERLAPASRLSFELGSVPLPSSLRESKSSAETVRAEAAHAAPPARPAKLRPIASMPDTRPAQPESGILPMKQVSPAQYADAEFRKAVAVMQQGHVADAIAGYEAVLRLDAGHDAARQALVALLLEGRRGAEAGRVLQDGLKNRPEHTGFAMLLARLQVEQGALDQAAATLEKSLPYADAQADYQAFFAALLQRRNRHKEAITHYQIALQLAPGNGVWLMGYGISLQAVQRRDDAREAFRRALESKTLNQELQAFVQAKLKELFED